MAAGLSNRRATWSAVTTAVCVIGAQIASKATRDALFLSNHAITDLPLMLMAASVVSIVVVLGASKLMVRYSPARLVPKIFFLSCLTLLGIWGLSLVDEPVAGIALYLHTSAFGVILISGFWSMINERFDPHTAKKTISRVVGGATFGGLIGGLLAERIGAYADVSTMLPVLAGLHLICGWRVRDLAPVTHHLAPDATGDSQARSAGQILKKESYLRHLALIVLLGTVTAAMLDYAYKAYATERFGDAHELMRFFATYYMALGLITFLVQTLFSRQVIEGLGPAKTVAVLPFITAFGSIGAILVPGLLSSVGARFSEAVLKSSFFRTGYELFFIPVMPNEKRATKTIIDVGFDRLGDVIGGGVIKLVLLLAPLAAIRSLLGVALALSAVSLVVAVFLKRGYVRALEKSLLRRDVSLDEQHNATHSMILKTLNGLNVEQLSQLEMKTPSSLAAPEMTPKPMRVATAMALDPIARQVADLRSGDLEKIRTVLFHAKGPDPVLTPHLLALFAWDEIYPDAVLALSKYVDRVVGQLNDVLLNEDEEFTVRRRIPVLMAVSSTQRAVDGLIRSLSDRRFELRYKCGKALAGIRERALGLRMEPKQILRAAEWELGVEQHVWTDRRLLDVPGQGCELPYFDSIVGHRADPSLEHIFTLLSLVLEPKPLKVAFRGIHTSDEMLRGTALEYLDAILASRIKEAMFAKLGDYRPRKMPQQDVNKATQNLMLTSALIEQNLVGLDEVEV